MALKIQSFVFSPWSENTYVLSDETGQCVIIDPGCYGRPEESELSAYIRDENLKPVLLLNTHCHLDHVFGNHYVKQAYDIPFLMHEKDMPILHSAPKWAEMYGFRMIPSPDPDKFLEEGDVVEFGNSRLEVLFTPGHAPGHIVFYHRESQNLIAGDVLFQGSIGRTDLPGGDYDTLIDSIMQKVIPLGDEVVVHCGHGPTTTIKDERMYNPFLTNQSV